MQAKIFARSTGMGQEPADSERRLGGFDRTVAAFDRTVRSFDRKVRSSDRKVRGFDQAVRRFDLASARPEPLDPSIWFSVGARYGESA